jgi:hypothetical protein
MSQDDDFWIIVGRATHELVDKFGLQAAMHADQLSEQAKADQDEDSSRFWAAVKASCQIRKDSNLTD